MLQPKTEFSPKNEIDSYLKNISRFIIDNIGETEYGPAASLRDIVRAIVRNTNEVLSVATAVKFPDIPEPTFIGIPKRLGKSIGSSIFDVPSIEEKAGIEEAAKAIYQTYRTVLGSLT
jgi:malate/lactate dehydrogenase